MTLVQVALEFLTQNVTVILCVGILVAVTQTLLKRSAWRLPPGPVQWPVVGNMFLMSPTDEDFSGAIRMWQLAKKLNTDIISMKVGPATAVVLSNFDDIKEAFSRDDFSGSDPNFALHMLAPGLAGIEGEMWKEQRRFALSTMRDFGSGKNQGEILIQQEIERFTKEVKQKNGKPFDPELLLKFMIANIISQLIFGHRFEYDDVKMVKMLRLQDERLVCYRLAALPTMFPLLGYLPGDMFGVKKLKHLTNVLYSEVLQPEYDNHINKYDPNNIKDLMDAYIREIKAREGSTERHWFTEQQLLHVVNDLFLGGTDTSTVTLSWCLLYMAKYESVQSRVRAEICDVVGQERYVGMHDKTQLPYTEAVLAEILRCKPLSPILFTHNTTDVVHFKGYVLPPKTRVLTNWHAINHDPLNWQLPNTFMPERFLDEQGKFKKVECLAPFSVGKRACPGESLARMELFLIFAALVQKFQITFQPGAPQPSMLAKSPATQQTPRPYSICMQSLQQI